MEEDESKDTIQMFVIINIPASIPFFHSLIREEKNSLELSNRMMNTTTGRSAFEPGGY